MKVLLIGFGSIGKRHFEVLSSLSLVSKIDLVTMQDIDNLKCYKKLDKVKNLDTYDYFIIASETSKHYAQLVYIESKVKNKIIFCEKPLFEIKKDLKICNNKLFVGYVLRFHPLLNKLKKLLENENIIYLHAKCGQYLPTWRPNMDYKNCYSAKKEEGGGVLLDLSHEIDYVQWLGGSMKEIKSINNKISDLEINSDDLCILIGKTQNDCIVNVSIDYISKITHRKIIVETFESSYELDFINNKLIKENKNKTQEVFEESNLERNFMFEQMHLDILGEQKYICTFREGMQVMNTISIIQEQSSE